MLFDSYEMILNPCISVFDLTTKNRVKIVPLSPYMLWYRTISKTWKTVNYEVIGLLPGDCRISWCSQVAGYYSVLKTQTPDDLRTIYVGFLDHLCKWCCWFMPAQLVWFIIGQDKRLSFHLVMTTKHWKGFHKLTGKPLLSKHKSMNQYIIKRISCAPEILTFSNICFSVIKVESKR